MEEISKIRLPNNSEYTLRDSVSRQESEVNTRIVRELLDEMSQQSKESINIYLKKRYAVSKTGKVFTTKFAKFSVSTSPTGIKIDDNEGMRCVPSTSSKTNIDDYDSIPMFHPLVCNWELDNTGQIIITALEGDNDFKKDGTNGQVGVVNMPWYVKAWDDENYWYISVTDTEYEGYTLLKECKKPDGSQQGFMVHAKYAMVDYYDEEKETYLPYSASGYKPCANDVGRTGNLISPSYTGLISACQRIGNVYCAETSSDLFFIQLLFMIKYGTLNSQSVMSGCTSYYYNYQCQGNTTNDNYVILTTANANTLLIGSTVWVGSSNTDDRGLATACDIVYAKRIAAIEPIEGTNNSKVVLDVSDEEKFSSTSMSFLKTMPWYTGACDTVRGNDGSPINPTSGKEPFIINKIECMIGGYEVLGNVVMDIQLGEGNTVYRDVYICKDASALTSSINTIKSSSKWNKSEYTIPGNANAWKYISECGIDLDNGIMIPTAIGETGSGSSTGFCDGCYNDSATSGQREWLSFGDLYYGGRAGAWYLLAYVSLSNTYWGILSRISPNGMCDSQ